MIYYLLSISLFIFNIVNNKIYILDVSYVYTNYIILIQMVDKVHIRVSKEMKHEMQDLIEGRVFKDQGEIAREGIRKVLQKWLT